MALVLVALVLAAGTAQAATWYCFQGHKYCLTGDRVDWAAAERIARNLGGHLAAINSAAEERWLVKTFGSAELYWNGLLHIRAVDVNRIAGAPPATDVRGGRSSLAEAKEN